MNKKIIVALLLVPVAHYVLVPFARGFKQGFAEEWQRQMEIAKLEKQFSLAE